MKLSDLKKIIDEAIVRHGDLEVMGYSLDSFASNYTEYLSPTQILEKNIGVKVIAPSVFGKTIHSLNDGLCGQKVFVIK